MIANRADASGMTLDPGAAVVGLWSRRDDGKLFIRSTQRPEVILRGPTDHGLEHAVSTKLNEIHVPARIRSAMMASPKDAAIVTGR